MPPHVRRALAGVVSAGALLCLGLTHVQLTELDAGQRSADQLAAPVALASAALGHWGALLSYAAIALIAVRVAARPDEPSATD